MGIVTVHWHRPLGMLAIGMLSEQLGLPWRSSWAGLGVGGLGLVWTKLIEARSDR
jgi:hypothetical protein